MKYLKSFNKFESVGFGHNITGMGSDEGLYNHKYNQNLRLKAKTYYDNMTEDMLKKLCKRLNINVPKDLKDIDAFKSEKEKSIVDFLVENPSYMDMDNDVDIKKDTKFTMDDTDRVPITNNIGGAGFANSIHVGQ